MVVFGCAHHLVRCLSLLLVPVPVPISVNGSCFSVYFPTSFFPPSPWNLIGLSPLLWRLRIRLSTSQASSTLRNVEKEGNDKKEGAIGDWGWGPPVTRSRSMYYVIWGKVLVNSLPRCEEELSDTITTGRKLHLIDRFDEPHCFRLHKYRVFMPLNLLWNWWYL